VFDVSAAQAEVCAALTGTSANSAFAGVQPVPGTEPFKADLVGAIAGG
jgi:hypothetical protein